MIELTSITGRVLSTPPSRRTKSSNKITAKLSLKFDAWKVKEAVLEAQSRGDKWNELLPLRINTEGYDTYSEADMQYVGNYLFGDQH